MNPRQEQILIEMGLGPRWRLRSATPRVASGPLLATAQSRRIVEEGVDAQARPSAGATNPARTEDAFASPGGEERSTGTLSMDWPTLKSAVSSCQACNLCKTRTHTVFGVGDERAEWMIVGEAPGADEDARGEPFVGQAGRLLDSMLAALDLSRSKNVYIANVLKCRPPGNRNPEPTEVAQCSPYLIRQIALIRPKLIIAMGRFAAQTLLASDASISSMRGRRHAYQGVPLIVTYHPAYLLRSLHDKAKAWEDLVFARRVMKSLAADACDLGARPHL